MPSSSTQASEIRFSKYRSAASIPGPANSLNTLDSCSIPKPVGANKTELALANKSLMVRPLGLCALTAQQKIVCVAKLAYVGESAPAQQASLHGLGSRHRSATPLTPCAKHQ